MGFIEAKSDSSYVKHTICSRTVKTSEVVLCSVTEHGITPFHFQTAQKNSALLRSSLRQFENKMRSYRAAITEQCTPSYVLTV